MYFLSNVFLSKKIHLSKEIILVTWENTCHRKSIPVTIITFLPQKEVQINKIPLLWSFCQRWKVPVSWAKHRKSRWFGPNALCITRNYVSGEIIVKTSGWHETKSFIPPWPLHILFLQRKKTNIFLATPKGNQLKQTIQSCENVQRVTKNWSNPECADTSRIWACIGRFLLMDHFSLPCRLPTTRLLEINIFRLF